MQHWKQAEKDFEASFAAHGKNAAVFRLSDTAMAKAVGGSKAFVAPQPSDYIVTLDGETFFAEVKSTIDEDAFHFSNIRKDQLGASRKAVKAGGKYLFFIKSVEHDQWFCVPAQLIHQTIAQKVKHLKWDQIQDYKYEL